VSWYLSKTTNTRRTINDIKFEWCMVGSHTTRFLGFLLFSSGNSSSISAIGDPFDICKTTSCSSFSSPIKAIHSFRGF